MTDHIITIRIDERDHSRIKHGALIWLTNENIVDVTTDGVREVINAWKNGGWARSEVYPELYDALENLVREDEETDDTRRS